MTLLSVKHLSKHYEAFDLTDVSFQLEPGYIMGYIGRNGAGKTTTLKSLLGLIHPDSGTVTVDGLDFSKNERACKAMIGFACGGVSYYPRKRLKTITDVTRQFYDHWDESTYQDCLQRFELSEDKKINQLSEGMKLKYALALALSHNAKLLILDEPTSGLDPVSRDDLLTLFQKIIEDGEHSILFSTHITSDLERCADYITYIQDGHIIANQDKDSLLEAWRLISGKKTDLTPELARKMVGCQKNRFGFEGMIATGDLPQDPRYTVGNPDLEAIMVHIERKGETL
ncbi:MAG: ABC transporter ATP-binding protein [Eubacteriaceae bacterium]|nr:ABC transporter ATP-binding protein [Eubacteriaceae bacterium]MDD4509001.1 ABC transporter ATP-binding protein [Eubacteriaceae bacterium]